MTNPQIPNINPSEAIESNVTPVREDLRSALSEILAEHRDEIQETMVGYARESAVGVLTGKGSPNLIPDVTAVTATGRELTVASAKNRSWRTFVQGFGIDLGFALVAVMAMVGNMDFFDKAAWVTLGVLLVKTIIQTAVSYVARIKISPSYDKGLESLPASSQKAA